jgi:hypothetical protein
VIPNLALIITCYILYRLIETTVSAVQRNRTAGIVLGVLAGVCALVVCSLAFEIVSSATHTSSWVVARTITVRGAIQGQGSRFSSRSCRMLVCRKPLQAGVASFCDTPPIRGELRFVEKTALTGQTVELNFPEPSSECDSIADSIRLSRSCFILER